MQYASAQYQRKKNLPKLRLKLKQLLNNNPEEASLEGLAAMACAAVFETVTNPDFFDDVKEFQDHLGQTKLPVTPELIYFRQKLIHEEYNEYVQALKIKEKEAQLDALIDLIYVCIGNILAEGWDGKEAWRRIHHANMKKIPGKTERSRGVIDAVKPHGWRHPLLTDLV